MQKTQISMKKGQISEKDTEAGKTNICSKKITNIRDDKHPNRQYVKQRTNISLQDKFPLTKHGTNIFYVNC
jgi:hypothetical protein